MPNYWLFKSEPSDFSLDDLRRAPRQTTFWSGVRNFQARNFLRDQVKPGDGVLFYHSSTANPAVVGTCKISRGAYPDPTQFDRKSDYFDPGSTREEPRWVVVDVTFESEFARPVTLEQLRAEPRVAEMVLLRRGNRLSVMPVTAAEWAIVCRLGKG